MAMVQEKLEAQPVAQHTDVLVIEGVSKDYNIEFERGLLLAGLPDPDDGKKEEERKIIDKKLMWKVDLWIVPWLSVL